MITYIVLLRGINVGGHKKVPMADLREVLAESGFNNVKTYIQSGNIILHTSETRSTAIENTIHDAIQTHFGFDVSVMAKSRDQLLRIFDDSPFPQDKKEQSYFAVLHTIPDSHLVETASEKAYENEDYYIINDCIYLYCKKGYGSAKFNLNYFERILKTNATARNYRTMAKLLELSSS